MSGESTSSGSGSEPSESAPAKAAVQTVPRAGTELTMRQRALPEVEHTGSIASVLRALAEHFEHGSSAGKLDRANGERRLIPKDQKKFRKLDQGNPAKAGSAVAEPAEGEAEEEQDEAAAAEDSPQPVVALAGGETPAAKPDRPPARKRPAPGRARGARKWEPARLITSTAFQLSVLCLMALSFYLGRVSPPRIAAALAAPAAPIKPLPSPEAAVSPTAKVLDVIDQAMAAEKAGDFPKAFALCNDVEREAPNTSGILLHLTQLAIENGEPGTALKLARNAIDQGDSLPMSYVLLGQLVQRSSGTSESLQDFEQAALADPFEAKYFFYWGEALRRAGHPQEAAQRLTEAIARLREPALEGLYHIKLRLTQIEMGQEADFAAEMARNLALSAPAPQWLLTAAAVAMWHNQPVVAAKYLEEASQRTDPAALHSLLRDYFFANYASDPALARFFTGVAADSHPSQAAAPNGVTLAPGPPASTPANALDVAPLPPSPPPAPAPVDSRS